MVSDDFAELDPARDEAPHAITNAATWRPLTTSCHPAVHVAERLVPIHRSGRRQRFISPIHRRTSMIHSLSCTCTDSTYIGKSKWCKHTRVTGVGGSGGSGYVGLGGAAAAGR